MQGLPPTISLSDREQSWFVDPSEATNAEDRAAIERQNRTAARNMAELDPGRAKGPGPRRSWIEPQWDTPQPAAAQPTAGPLDVLKFQGGAALDDILAQSQAKRAELDKRDEPELLTLRELSQVDVQAILDSNLPNEEKQAKLKDAEIRARKREIEIRAKTRDERTALDIAVEKAKSDVTSAQRDKQIIIQTIYAQGAKHGQDPEDTEREALEVLGVKLPPKVKQAVTPSQRLQELAPILRDQQMILNTYRRMPGQGPGAAVRGLAWVKGVQLKTPAAVWKEYNPITKQYDIDVPLETAMQLDQTETNARDLRVQVDQLQRQVMNRPMPSLGIIAGAAISPLAQAVTRVEGEPLSDAQARTFLQQAGGDKQKARELARNQGYEIR